MIDGSTSGRTVQAGRMVAYIKARPLLLSGALIVGFLLIIWAFLGFAEGAAGAPPAAEASSVDITPTASVTPSPTIPTAGMADHMDMEVDTNELMKQVQVMSRLMQDARQRMDDLMAGQAPSDAMIAQTQADLDDLQFMMRTVTAQMQSSMAQTPGAVTPGRARAANPATFRDRGMVTMREVTNMTDRMMSVANDNRMAAISSPIRPTNTSANQATWSRGAPANASLTRSAEAGNVTVTVLPLNLGALNGSTLDFQVTLETHSVALNQDLTTQSVLQLTSGVEISPIWWDGSSSSHHVRGTLSFPRTDSTGVAMATPGSGALTLIIRDLAGIPERTFSWDLGQ